MTTSQQPPSAVVGASVRAYRALLILYPAAFRRDYGSAMTQVFRDVCRDAYRRGGLGSLIGWWAASLFDLLRTVLAEHRKGDVIVTKTRFIHLSGWLCLFGGLLIGAGGLSQLQPGSHYRFTGLYQLSIVLLVPGYALVSLGLVGLLLRFNRVLNLFGRLFLWASLIGAALTAGGWLFTLSNDSAWAVFMIGFLVHLAGQSVFAGYAATVRLLPRWNWAMLIGSALPLTVALLSLRSTEEAYGANWGAFAMLLLMGGSWVLTGIALNYRPHTSIQAAAA